MKSSERKRPVVRAYAHKSNDWFEHLKSAVHDANGLQTEFKFQLESLGETFTGANGTIDVSDLENKLSTAASPLRGFILCDGQFSIDDLLVEKLPNRVYLSRDQKLEQSQNDLAPRVFILYQLIAAALTVGVKLSAAANEQMTHPQPVGCLWDWWRDANQRSATMLAARICPRCQEKLKQPGDVDESKIRAAQQMLDYVRRSILVGKTEVPDRILIAHGHGADWKVLAEMLRKWNLFPDSFEAQSPAGRLVTEQWQRMLNRARLAFAVMMRDDPGSTDDVRRARQNVIHEIGLCHARLGVHDTIILTAEDIEPFTNIDGVITIRFQEGRLAEKRNEIEDALKDRNIL